MTVPGPGIAGFTAHSGRDPRLVHVPHHEHDRPFRTVSLRSDRFRRGFPCGHSLLCHVGRRTEHCRRQRHRGRIAGSSAKRAIQ